MLALHLERALALRDLDAVRAELLAAWVLAPQERLARLVELVDAKLDAVLPYQLANLGSAAAAKATAVLAGIPPDPRVAPELLDLLAKPPWRSNPALPFWRACCERIVFTRDARILARLEEVALGYPKTIPTSVGHKVGGYLNKAALQLRAAIATIIELDARAAAACEALERALGARPVVKTTGTEIVDVLLAAVYEAPHDDAPRLVLADHLVQRGDPRGEFINLQLARAAGRADDTTRARELELLAKSGGVWTGRIGMVFDAEHFVFHRGFVAYGQLPRSKDTLSQFEDDPAWSTLQIVDINGTNLTKADRGTLAKILAGPEVRAVIGAPLQVLEMLEPEVLAKLERLEHVDVAARPGLVERWLVNARRPRCLGVAPRVGTNFVIETVREHVDMVVALPGFDRLEQLVVQTHQPQTYLGWLEKTTLPKLSIVMGPLRVDLEREGTRFVRATVRHPRGHRGGFPEAVMRHIVTTLADREVVVDARTPFYPGMEVGHAVAKNWKTLEGVVDDLDLVGR